MITAFSLIIVVFFIIQKKKQVQSFLQQQQLKFEYEHALLSTRIEVQEQAFEAVSRDIHDNIGQMLSLGCIRLASLKNMEADVQKAEQLNEILVLFKKTVKDLRLLSHSLNTGLIEHRELEHSILAELDRIETFGGIKCTLTLVSGEEVLPIDKRLIVFRIIQEALQNVVKHARATSLSIVLEQDDARFIVRIADDGIGFEQDPGRPVRSLGMISMQQRAGMLGASLDIDSAPGSGTLLTLAIPINS